MSSIDKFMDGFYRNDYSDKDIPSGYKELKVQAYEMKSELQRLINTRHTIKTGFRGKAGDKNRIYVIFYKK